VADLRDIIREEVMRVLAAYERRGHTGDAPSARGTPRCVAVLFSGWRWPAEPCFEQLSTLAARGMQLEFVVSDSFRELFAERLAAQGVVPPAAIVPRREPELLALGRRADACIAAGLSPTAATKLTTGISDSIPTILVRSCLENAKPVIVAEDSATLRANAVAPGAPPKLRRLAEDAYQGLAEMGVHFTAPSELAATLDRVFFVPVNETPERLARTRPHKQRMFVTAEDVWKASTQGHRQMVLPADAVVTDEARDHARRIGIEIVREA